MPPYAHMLCESPILLWGLSTRQRLERAFRRTGRLDFLEDIESIPPQSSVILIRGDYLFDNRVINSLIEAPGVVLQIAQEGRRVAVAAHVPAGCARQARELLDGRSSEESLPGVRTETLGTLCSAFEERLRKSDPPFVLPITEENRGDLEKRLFASSYKGVTDLITKWAWPRPAAWCTRQCVRLGLSPNQVTFIGFVLVLIATALFSYGHFAWGLLAGWVMTFLDTVDGKLARVTITSSRFGHLFDHVIDLVHPPIWYVAWGLGLGVSYVVRPELSLQTVLWVIVAGYIVGRLVELAFSLWLGPFGIFCWQPVDSYFRLITARRNPNLILLTAAAVTGHPALGLLAVAFWTVLTSLFLLIRLAMAAGARIASGPLRTWLSDIDQRTYERSLAAKLFSSRPESAAPDEQQ